jgi:hypothetical protein
VPSPLALLVSIVALAMWTIWVVRSGRAGRWVQLVPVVACVAGGALELCAMHALQEVRDRVSEINPAEKATVLAQGIGRASAFAVGAWTVVSAAALVLLVLTLRRPPDDDGVPPARVVSE